MLKGIAYNYSTTRFIVFFFLMAMTSVVLGAGKETIRVETFSNHTGKQDLDYLKEAIPEQIRTTLARFKGFRVLEGNNASSYLVKGSFTGRKSDLKVQIRIVEVSSGGVAASQTVNGDLETILDNVSKSTKALAKSILLGKAEGTSLAIDTQPQGASIYIDDFLVGESPISSYEITPGRHQIKIEKAGYQTTKFLVTAKAGETTEVVRSLQPKSESQRNSVGFSLLYLVNPFSDKLWDGSMGGSLYYQLQVKAFRIGFDTTFLFRRTDFYKYSVPYSFAKDKRYYHFLQAGMSLHFVPDFDWNSISPYFGLRTGYLQFWDFRRADGESTLMRSSSRMYLGPVVGLTIFPKSNASFYIEGRYDFVLQDIRRREIDKATLFSGPEASGKTYSVQLFTVGGGVSVNF